MTSQQRKAEVFRDLHQGDAAFIIANPWDQGSARVLEGLGFAALASTSAGFAQTLGRLDGRVSLAEKLAHVEALCAAVRVPLSVDLENGFGHTPDDVARSISAVADAGAVGASIEDFDGNGIYAFELAVERVQAAVQAARALDFPFTLTARAENLLRGVDDPDDTIRRLQAFEAAGADVLYAPGIGSLELLRRVCASVSRPVNVLAPMLPGASLAELADAGARRVSVGGALAMLSMGPVLAAGREMLEQGTFKWMAGVRDGAESMKFLTQQE
jgi:2-methylisocitrate lyase-like PEP mutase family enzyme